jgi:hypothetical protein
MDSTLSIGPSFLFLPIQCLMAKNVDSDLKPENILLDYTGHIALCDFGKNAFELVLCS